jgi:hypothetical protein
MPEPIYHSFMLRLWREQSQAPWRVTLFAVTQPDQRRQFDTLEDCFAFLRQQAGETNGTPNELNDTHSTSSQTD